MLKNALSAKRIAAAGPGKYRDGEGLQFEVKGGSRRWTFTYSMHGKAREIAIGTYPAMSLAEAREKRAKLREAKDRGLDPAVVLYGKPIGIGPTFAADVARYVEHMQGEWVPEHKTEWVNSVNRVAGPLMPKRTADLKRSDILEVIEPIWREKNNTAMRVLKRIEVVFNYASAIDPERFEGRTNPCMNITMHLPRVIEDARPRAAMPWRELPEFMKALSRRMEKPAGALEFLLLTCCPRTREVTMATWQEIDVDLWNIPAGHMKSRRARTIPLTLQARKCLDDLGRPNSPHARIFEMDEDAMQRLMRDMGSPYTVHGFRSSFMDWVAECHPGRIMEAERALDHAIGNAVQRAYLRTNLLDQRRQLAELWAEMLLG